jgi:hypothetical protein
MAFIDPASRLVKNALRLSNPILLISFDTRSMNKTETKVVGAPAGKLRVIIDFVSAPKASHPVHPRICQA